MAFDPDHHELHPATGFMIDKRTGAPTGLLPLPHPVSESSDFPKWVTPHESHIHRRDNKSGAPLHVSVPLFPNFHVGRDGAVTVLVDNEEYEKFALAEKGTMEPPVLVGPDMPPPGFVHHPATEGYPWGWWGPKEALEPTAMAPVLFGAPPDEQSNESGAAEQLPHHEGEDA